MNLPAIQTNSVPQPASTNFAVRESSASRRAATPAGAPTSGTDHSIAGPTELVPLNLEELRRRCMGRLDFAERLLASFEKRFPVEVLEFEQSLDAEDMPRLARLAHQLKGAAANIGAPSLHQIMKQVEETVCNGQLAETARWLPVLKREWERFTEFKESIGGAEES